MSTAEKIVMMENAETTTIQEKETFLTKLKNNTKLRKVGKYVLRAAEGLGILTLGYMVGKKAGINAVAIPAEGSVEDTDEDEEEAE